MWSSCVMTEKVKVLFIWIYCAQSNCRSNFYDHWYYFFSVFAGMLSQCGTLTQQKGQKQRQNELVLKLPPVNHPQHRQHRFNRMCASWILENGQRVNKHGCPHVYKHGMVPWYLQCCFSHVMLYLNRQTLDIAWQITHSAENRFQI